MEIAEVGHFIEVYEHALQQISHYTDLRDRSRVKIEEALGEAEEGTVNGVPRVQWTRSERRALDQKRLAEDYPDVREECMKDTVVRTFKLVKP